MKPVVQLNRLPKTWSRVTKRTPYVCALHLEAVIVSVKNNNAADCAIPCDLCGEFVLATLRVNKLPFERRAGSLEHRCSTSHIPFAARHHKNELPIFLCRMTRICIDANRCPENQRP